MRIGKHPLTWTPRIAFIISAASFLPATASGQLNIASAATTYTITFDGTLPGVSNGAFMGGGFKSSPSTGQLNSNAWASTGMSTGTLGFGGTRTNGDYARGTSSGNVSTGGFYCFNSAAIGSRSLGIQPTASDWTPGTLTLRVKNTMGTALTTLDVAYVLWVNNNGNRSSSFDLAYSTNNVSYTALAALDYTSSAGSNGLGFMSNNRSTVITGLNIPNNGYVYLRWSSNDAGGYGNNRDEFALDDISVAGNKPDLGMTGLTAFGDQCINGGPYGPNTFTITGTDLTAADVTVGAVSGFSFSTTSNGTYANPLSLTHGAGSFSKTIFVQFNPTAIANYSGDIVVGGGGAAPIQVAVDGSGVDAAPTVMTGAASGTTATTATLAGQITADGCSAITNYGIEYSTTPGFITGTGTFVSGSNLSGSAFSCGLSSLSPCTTYYFKARAGNSGGTGTGPQGQFTTPAIALPTAIAASSVNSSDLIANWNPVDGASGYQLDVSTSPTFSIPSPLTTTEGFDNGTTPPSGWTFTGINATGTGTANSGTSSPSVEFNANNEQVITPTLSSPASTLSFWVKNIFSFFSTSLLVEGYNGSTWSTIDNIQSLPATGNTQTYTGLTASGFIRFRFTFSTYFFGILAFDDVSYTCLCGSTPSFVPGYDNLAVPGTSQVVTGLQPLTTYYYRVRANGGACATTPNSNTIAVQTGHATYYSQGSGNLDSPIWSITPIGTAGPVSLPPASLVIQNGDILDNTGPTNVQDLTVDNGGTLNLHSGSQLTINGDHASFSGSVIAEDHSAIVLNGTGSTSLSSAGTLSLWDLTVNTPSGTQLQSDLDVRGTLLLNAGPFDATAATVKLVSTATGTGRLGPVASGAAYVGAMTVQRYIPAGHTNWRMLGSPVSGQTVASWQDDFFTAGYPGSAYPAFYSPTGSTTLWPSIRWYNETNTSAVADSGLVGVSSSSQPLSAGQGFYAWCGDNLTTTAAFTLGATGTPNIAQTPVTLPMSYTSSGTPAADGWNLVSNPLPSPIDITQLSFGANVAHQYWIFDPASGNTLGWSAGVGQGGLNGKVQSSQGFWLKANGPSVSTTVTEAAKTEEALDGGVFGGDQQVALPILRFKVTCPMNTFSDEATLVLDHGSPALDSLDAEKLDLHTDGAPRLSLFSSDDHELSIDFTGALGPGASIPLRLVAEVSGNYTVSISSTVQSLSCITLEDLVTGTLTPLSDGASYSFYSDATTSADIPRFLVQGTTSLPLAVTGPACAGANGQAAVSITGMPMDILWTTASGDTLSQQSGLAGSTVLLSDLPPGNYAVHAGPVEACGMLSADFSITAPSAMEIDTVSISPTTCANGVDGSVHLQVLGGSGGTSCVWDNGTIGPDLIAGAGPHEVTVTDSLGCTATTTFIIPAGTGPVAGFTAAPAFVDEPVALVNTSQMSSSWSWDFGDGSTSEDSTPVHSWSDPGTYTVSLTATDGICSDAFTMDIPVSLGVPTTIADAPDRRGFAAWSDRQNITILHPFGKQPVDVNVIDATGRTTIRLLASMSPDRIEIPDQDMPTGIWFVRVTSGDMQHTFRVPVVR
jgi:hypothetical protein